MRLDEMLIVVLLAAGSIAAERAGSQGPDPSLDPDEPKVKAFAEFGRHVAEYARLHRVAAASVAPLQAGETATEISARRKMLADAIRARRAGAQQGDIFTAAVRPVIVGIVQGYLTSPEGAPARVSVARENPATTTPLAVVELAVNGRYEAGASFSTMPTTLLMKLPALPEEVEFRFVGRHLLLRDTTANIILDYILDAAP
jgi:hypothetical protein